MSVGIKGCLSRASLSVSMHDCCVVSQDHEVLLHSRQDVEKQLEEQKMTLETQKKRYADMEVRV